MPRITPVMATSVDGAWALGGSDGVVRPARTFVAISTGVTLVSAVVFLGILAIDGELASTADLLVQSGFLAFIGGFAAVGAVLTVHRPDNAVGWLMAGLASSLALRSACEELAVRLYDGSGSESARWVALGVNALDPVWLTLLVGLAAVFPHGQLPGQWWRRAMRTVVVLGCVAVVLAPFATYEGSRSPSPPSSTRVSAVTASSCCRFRAGW